MNHPVAIVFIDPPRCLALAVSVVAALVCLWSLWRRTAAARLMAELNLRLADVVERGGLTDEAAQYREQARKWRRLAWPRRARPAKTTGGAS